MINVRVVWFREKFPTWKTKLIMWGMGTDYSHVAMIGANDDGKQYIFHAVGKGVCLEQADAYENDERWVVREKIVPLACDVPEVRGFAWGAKDKDYSETNLALIVLAQKFRASWAISALTWLFGDGEREVTCGELITIILKKWSPYIIEGDVDRWTPRDIELLLEPDIIPWS